MNRGKLNLDCAVQAYSEGKPVVVRANDGSLLHGQQTLEAIRSLGTGLECLVVEDISAVDWNNSDWPELLEAAREVFMQRGGFELRNAR